jgi:hypothetical protein
MSFNTSPGGAAFLTSQSADIGSHDGQVATVTPSSTSPAPYVCGDGDGFAPPPYPGFRNLRFFVPPSID